MKVALKGQCMPCFIKKNGWSIICLLILFKGNCKKCEETKGWRLVHLPSVYKPNQAFSCITYTYSPASLTKLQINLPNYLNSLVGC